ncbi:MAG: 6-phosphogluconate dehydrogenase, partial [Actinobacteria bacterium]
HGHEVVAHDRDADAVKAAAAGGAQGVDTLDAVAGALEPPRAVWLMLPAGGPTDETVGRLAGLLAAGDTVVDGGNANYHDSIGHGQLLAAKGIGFVDAGVSGG